MKKYLFSSLLLALMAVVSFSLVSCDDDDDAVSGYSLVGTWSVEGGNAWGNEMSPDDYNYKEYMQLKSDGSCVDVQDDDGDVYVQYGTWSLDGNVLTIEITTGDLAGMTIPYTIIEQSQDEVKVSLWGLTAYLERVSDDVINQYL